MVHGIIPQFYNSTCTIKYEHRTQTKRYKTYHIPTNIRASRLHSIYFTERALFFGQCSTNFGKRIQKKLSNELFGWDMVKSGRVIVFIQLNGENLRGNGFLAGRLENRFICIITNGQQQIFHIWQSRQTHRLNIKQLVSGVFVGRSDRLFSLPLPIRIYSLLQRITRATSEEAT